MNWLLHLVIFWWINGSEEKELCIFLCLTNCPNHVQRASWEYYCISIYSEAWPLLALDHCFPACCITLAGLHTIYRNKQSPFVSLPRWQSLSVVLMWDYDSHRSLTTQVLLEYNKHQKAAFSCCVVTFVFQVRRDCRRLMTWSLTRGAH